jgi:hypothetical protein
MTKSQNLLSQEARIQVPWIKITMGAYTFGVFADANTKKNEQGVYSQFDAQYPNFVQSLNIVKINGQVNQYTLQITYPVKSTDDPNFFEKIFSSISSTRKIVFSYGDMSMPNYLYKDEEAIITGITQQFNLVGATINYTIKAVSSAALASSGAFTFTQTRGVPSKIIKDMFQNPTYGLGKIFTGMDPNRLNDWIDSTDGEVDLEAKVNISPLDYINYLTSCMIPAGETTQETPTSVYILTFHDDTTYDRLYTGTPLLPGPYFKITKVTSIIEHADAYEIDIGYNTSTIVRSFSIEDNENYAILYNYNAELAPEQYSMKLSRAGKWESVYSPMMASANTVHQTRAEDKTWLSKVTKYPISATIQVQGLLRPVQLMKYIRLRVLFPGASGKGGNLHMSSGLYLITKQVDDIGPSGYYTTLNMTRIGS